MKSVFFISLGCDKNLVDSEVMIGELSARGYVFCETMEEADAVIVNTCCFIGDAKEESVNTILEAADLKNIVEKPIDTNALMGVLDSI